MGANQSSTDGTQQQKRGGGGIKACYYELLAVDRHATDEEIKKAYRKKALELHPDRNYGNVDEATKLFAEVQAAYEVLSDPHERAWYDSHRDAILRDDNEANPDHYEHNVRITTAEDIMRMFTRFNVHMDYSDSPTGFFSVLRGTFDTLVREEIAACEWEGLDPLEYPSFGNSKDSYEGVVRPFYAAWSGFATKKTFSWKDVFRYSEAPDRRVRRMMEKENKRLRDDGIREFNDAVRSLVAFVRKRDPRYIPNTQTEAERQRLLRDAAAAQAVRSRAANRAKLDDHVEAEWSKSREPDEEEDSEEEIEEEQFECVACGKTFKSEKQFETHEKSKKHLKTLQQLRRQIQRENKEFGLGDISGGRPDIPGTVEDEAEEEDRDSADEIGQQVQNEMNGAATSQGDLSDQGADERAQPSIRPGSALSVSTAEKYFCDEYAPRDEVESRLADHVEQLTDATAAASIASDSSTPRKVGKAKEKRAKRAAQKKTAAGDLNFTCAACNERFPSRTKLFTHLKDEGHAHYVPKTTKGSGKGKKR